MCQNTGNQTFGFCQVSQNETFEDVTLGFFLKTERSIGRISGRFMNHAKNQQLVPVKLQQVILENVLPHLQQMPLLRLILWREVDFLL